MVDESDDGIDRPFTQKKLAFAMARDLAKAGRLVIGGVNVTLSQVHIPLEADGYRVRLLNEEAMAAPVPETTGDTVLVPDAPAVVPDEKPAPKPRQAGTPKPVTAPKPVPVTAPKPAAEPVAATSKPPAPAAPAPDGDEPYMRLPSDSGSSKDQVLGNRAMVALFRDRGTAGATANELRDASGFKTAPSALWFGTLAERNGFVLTTGANGDGKRTFIATFPEGNAA